MAGFIFKLQSLLDLKGQLEENQKNELGKAVKKLEAEKAELEKLELEKSEHINELKQKAANGIRVDSLKRHNQYIMHMNTAVALQKENVNYARFRVDKVRGDLLKVMQEREMLDKLKGRKHQSFLKEQEKAGQRINDEIISFGLRSGY